MPKWAHAYYLPSATGRIKTQTDDFIVEEHLPFQPEGSGEHVFLHIQKQGENTEYIARALARLANVRQRDVGFAGLKDRHGLTSQWFSVWLPTKNEPDWKTIECDSINVLKVIRHSRKLKRGVLTGNQFQLLIRDFSGNQALCEQRLTKIKANGFPNYFGEQRFGTQGRNIEIVRALFAGTKKMKRMQRGIYLSAARSYLFNQILSHRISQQNWNQAITGDIFMLGDSHSFFKSETLDESLLQRVNENKIHPTGCLYGKGDILAIEESIISKNNDLTTGLLKFGLEADRRALRVMPQNLEWTFLNQQHLQLRFFLPAGSYATALLREIMEVG